MAEFVEKYINPNEVLQVIFQAKGLSEEEINHLH